VVSTEKERAPLSIVPASVYPVGGSTGKFYAVGAGGWTSGTDERRGKSPY